MYIYIARLLLFAGQNRPCDFRLFHKDVTKLTQCTLDQEVDGRKKKKVVQSDSLLSLEARCSSFCMTVKHKSALGIPLYFCY